MKRIILLLALSAEVACQTKAPLKKASEANPSPALKPKWTDRNIAVGVPCVKDEYGNTGSFYSSGYPGYYLVSDEASHITWKIPSNERWSCVEGKWFRDAAKEESEHRHNAEVSVVRDLLLKRRLTAAELRLLPEAAEEPRWRGSMVSMSSGEIYGCNERARENAALIAQLSFWTFDESEIPLRLMLDYVKNPGVCGEAINRAYQIMNDRILAWFSTKTASK